MLLSIKAQEYLFKTSKLPSVWRNNRAAVSSLEPGAHD